MSSLKSFIVCTAIFVACLALPGRADSYLRVYATHNDGRDTVGLVEHYLEFGRVIPIFIPPYTARFNIFPLAGPEFKAEIEFYELGPGFANHRKEFTFEADDWQTVENLPSKGDKFSYSFIVLRDTLDNFNTNLTDSLTNFESIHFRSWLWRDSYADFKWEARKGYLENTYNFYRKEHQVKRSGKLDLHVLPGSNNSPLVDNITGLGFDFPGNSMAAVFNDGFDTALPQHTQRYVIYDSWGYSARSLVVGYSRYFLDDIFRARKLVSGMTTDEIKAIIMDEFPLDLEKADVICGSFSRFLISQYSLPYYKMLYEKSAPGKFAFDEVYDKSFDEMLGLYKEYQKQLRLTESDAFYISDIFTSQMWFDKALEYEVWLATQPTRRDFHLKSLGATFFFVGNYAESETCYTALNRRHPERPDAPYLLGLALLRNGKTGKAIKQFESVADTFPDAAKMLAEVYLDKREFDKAGRALEKVAEYPDSWTSILKARLALARGEDELAGAIVKRSLALSSQLISFLPGEARGYLDAAYGFMLNGLYDEAESELQAALFVEPRPYYRAAVKLAQGRLYDLNKKRKQAKEFYKQAIALNSGEYINTLAERYIKKPFKLK
ncbi:MAG: tetratricopeptide repeat protein [candidate division Zixibacteria bacterium]|nr:tetratricopeptide repeat protein [candidate division Zixibacteria bacterium]